jgi:hypothetical protein
MNAVRGMLLPIAAETRLRVAVSVTFDVHPDFDLADLWPLGLVIRGAAPATVDQPGPARTSSGGRRRTIGWLLVFCSTTNAIVPQMAGTHSEIAW